jgi:hypothetical protein
VTVSAFAEAFVVSEPLATPMLPTTTISASTPRPAPLIAEGFHRGGESPR